MYIYYVSCNKFAGILISVRERYLVLTNKVQFQTCSDILELYYL